MLDLILLPKPMDELLRNSYQHIKIVASIDNHFNEAHKKLRSGTGRIDEFLWREESLENERKIAFTKLRNRLV